MQLPEGGQANDQRELEPQPGISLTRRGCCTNNQPEPTIRRERDHTDARDKVKEGSESNGTPRSRGTRFLIESPAPAGTKEHVANLRQRTILLRIVWVSLLFRHCWRDVFFGVGSDHPQPRQHSCQLLQVQTCWDFNNNFC